jgi:hypothetical protein
MLYPNAFEPGERARAMAISVAATRVMQSPAAKRQRESAHAGSEPDAVRAITIQRYRRLAESKLAERSNLSRS